MPFMDSRSVSDRDQGWVTRQRDAWQRRLWRV